MELLRLALWDNGAEQEAITAISGAAGRQNFRTLADEIRGAFEPIPEGRYRSIGPVEWAAGEGNYSTVWSQALGPAVIEIYGERAIMLHVDGGAKGSAGCLCPISISGLKIVIAWWTERKPEWLECDWGLGTISKPDHPDHPANQAMEEPPPIHRAKIYAKPGAYSAYRDGVKQSQMATRIDTAKHGIDVAINGVKVAPEMIESITVEIAYRGKKEGK